MIEVAGGIAVPSAEAIGELFVALEWEPEELEEPDELFDDDEPEPLELVVDTPFAGTEEEDDVDADTDVLADAVVVADVAGSVEPVAVDVLAPVPPTLDDVPAVCPCACACAPFELPPPPPPPQALST